MAIAYPRAVQLWNLANPAAPHRIATIAAAANVPTNCGDCSNLDYIAFSPDGRTLATTAAHHAISLWDVSTPGAPRHLATLGHNTGPIAALAFSPAGSQLAYLRQNGELTVFSLTEPAHPVQTAIPGPPATLAQWGNYALSYSPDGTRLTAVVLIEEEGGGRTACSWNTTSLSQPLPADCRTDHFSIQRVHLHPRPNRDRRTRPPPGKQTDKHTVHTLAAPPRLSAPVTCPQRTPASGLMRAHERMPQPVPVPRVPAIARPHRSGHGRLDQARRRLETQNVSPGCGPVLWPTVARCRAAAPQTTRSRKVASAHDVAERT